ncbi:MAG: proton-translocating NADH-quinone oxidoreductase, chain [Paenibacillaceae bacterium]|jgi:NADH-quinone oxidoreductase subunit N|nr:proton-translocating NADH-quinone oxidoreductase, chain [Paenibacillaceae bacterium]
MLDFQIDFSVILVEVLLAALGIGLLVLGILVPKEQRKAFGYLAGFGLIGTLIASFTLYGANAELFNGIYVVDDFSVFFKQVFLAAAVLVVFSSFQYVERLDYRMEFYALVVFAALGASVMVSAGDLITMYTGLELMTISFFILTAFRKTEPKSSEAGLKYLILGAVSSAVLLYGLTIVYGIAGSTIFDEIAASLSGSSLEPALILGIVFLIAGFGFKISAVPFHMWSPDIYHGAPSPVTSLLSTGSKAAAFAVFVRVFLGALPDTRDTWVMLLAVIAAATMLFGNLAAIPQTNLKRMLAYSSVSQAGYILTGLVAANALGVKGIAFYTMIYVFASTAAFAVVIAVSNALRSNEIKDFAGLSQRSPLAAAVLTVAMLSMAGIPPLAGFVGKFYLFSAVVDQGFLWLAVIGLVMSMVSVYYYLSVVKVMYLGEATDSSPIRLPAAMQGTLIVVLLLTLFFGIYPEPLSQLAESASKVFLLP